MSTATETHSIKAQLALEKANLKRYLKQILRNPEALEEYNTVLDSHVGAVIRRNETRLKIELLDAKKEIETLKQQIENLKSKSKSKLDREGELSTRNGTKNQVEILICCSVCVFNHWFI